MTRLKRTESQALTRAALLETANILFGRDGYAATSLEKIAATAGFSKGAVYSNFDGKEAIFLEVLERQGRDSLAPLLAKIERAADKAEATEALVTWADDQSRNGNWALTILEYARLTGLGSADLVRQETILRSHWRELGDSLLRRFPELEEDPEVLGAMLHELAHAPAMTFVSELGSRSLMQLFLKRLFAQA